MSNQNQNTEMKLHAGTWEGNYLDAHGYRGKLRLHVDVKENELVGKYELTIADTDRSHTITGAVAGEYEGGAVQIQAALGKENVEFSAQVTKAGSFAAQCMFGVVNTPPKSELGGGVWIAWKYVK